MREPDPAYILVRNRTMVVFLSIPSYYDKTGVSPLRQYKKNVQSLLLGGFDKSSTS
jgi:hypothetical protein